MNTIYIQKLLNYVQKNYDDLQYDRGLFHWLMILSGFFKFCFTRVSFCHRSGKSFSHNLSLCWPYRFIFLGFD